MDNFNRPQYPIRKDNSANIAIYVSTFMIVVLVTLAVIDVRTNGFAFTQNKSESSSTAGTNASSDPVLQKVLADITDANTLWTEGNYPAMIAPTDDALTIANTDQEKAYAYYWRGLSYYKQNMMAKAKADEDKAVLLLPVLESPEVAKIRGK